MKQDFPALWAESPATLHREPTNGEMANGFPCGPLDLPLWNELMYRLGQSYREIATAIASSGQTLNANNTSQLWAAIQSVAAPPPALWHRGTDISTNALVLTATVYPAVSSYGQLVPYNVLENNDSADGGTTANFGPGLRPVVRSDGGAIRKGDWTKGQVVVLLDDGARLQLAGAAPAGVVQTQITNTFNSLAIAGGAGGYIEGVVSVVAGQTYSGLVGAGGARGLSNGQASTAGGTSSFTASGTTLSAAGGGGGGFGNGASVGITGSGGNGIGGDIAFAGAIGQNGIYIPTGTANNVLFGGIGGGSRFSPSTVFPYGNGAVPGAGPGGAGSGGVGTNDGGTGSPGIVIIMA